MTGRARKTKLADVAAEAGVSISTVSRVFSNPELLSPETVRNVREVAARLRYSANPVARALRAGDSPYLGVVVPDISNPYMTMLLKAAQQRSRARGLGVFVADTDDAADIERQVCEQFARQTRGILLCAPRMSVSHIREIADMIPVMLVNRPVDGIPCVYTDSAASVAELVDRLCGLGHTKIAYLPGPTGSWANKVRARAVADQARKRGAEFVKLAPTAARLEDGVAAARAVVDQGASAVVAFDDVLAAGLIEGFRQLKLSVPRDVSVAGHDDVMAGLVQPGLTTISGGSVRVAQLAVDRLLAEAEPGSAPDLGHLGVDTEVVWRASIGKPRA
ncbi:LacI family transcriptional regulator [Crossiella equi]|uniref:LacI family transcriptional regulator n=1 Tax=Crossiella equi TaxID=130796 RepID=A0ABS5AR63_9PSEU|nr:LacI family DNA-binding transcriptional regulator [Crossiella equi]MBP2479062.1 LacI family transcriptional regulator [Crossiella equi]